MSQNRRSFIKKFGATLGSLIVSGSLPGCGPKKDRVLSETKGEAKERKETLPVPGDPEWGQLRRCWLGLGTIDEDIRGALKPYRDRSQIRDAMGAYLAAQETVPKERIASHRALLSSLVARDQLDEPVAKHIQTAFEEAIYHVVRSMGTCYLALPIEYEPRKDLLQQADVLKGISADVDPATVAKAQAAITQDMAFFEIFKGGAYSYRSLGDNYGAGRLEASPEALEAAWLLTRLFLETPD